MNTIYRKLVELSVGKATKGADKASVPNQIEILQTGTWNSPTHGQFMITAQDMQEFVDNFNAGVRKGVPIDLEHNDIGGAVGWVDSLEIQGNSLYANISWTPQGEQAIQDRTYRFFSPEFAPIYIDPETGAEMENVLIGGGLTNRPFFKNLQAVAASDKTKDSKSLTSDQNSNIIYLSEEKTMNLEEVKAKNLEDLTDAEKAFLAEHVDQLSEEEKVKFELVKEDESSDEDKGEEDKGEESEDDKSEDESSDEDKEDDSEGEADEEAADEEAGDDIVTASEKAVTITAAELDVLKRQASEGAEALQELSTMKASETVKSWCFNGQSGHIPVTAAEKVTEFYVSLDSKQQKKFAEIITSLPTPKVFGEVGASSTPDDTAAKAVQKKAAELMKDDKGMKFSEALKQLAQTDPELVDAYNKEVENK